MTVADRIALIESFARAWTARDVDALMALMAQDCEFKASIGPEPGMTFTGRAAVRQGYELFLGAGGSTTTEEEEMAKHGLVHKSTRMLDASVNCRVEEWVPGVP